VNGDESESSGTLQRLVTGRRTPLQSKAESAYPRPRDRRLSRKTRAAVGKPPGSTIAVPGVSSADSPGADSAPVRHRENASTPAAAASHEKLAQHRPSSIFHWLSQPG